MLLLLKKVGWVVVILEEILQLLGQIISKKNLLQFTKNLDPYTKNSLKN